MKNFKLKNKIEIIFKRILKKKTMFNNLPEDVLVMIWKMYSKIV